MIPTVYDYQVAKVALLLESYFSHIITYSLRVSFKERHKIYITRHRYHTQVYHIWCVNLWECVHTHTYMLTQSQSAPCAETKLEATTWMSTVLNLGLRKHYWWLNAGFSFKNQLKAITFLRSCFDAF